MKSLMMTPSITNSPDVCSYGEDTKALAAHALSLSPRTVLDMGTGTGYIAIALAQQGVQSTATDISTASVHLAQQNADRNQVSIRCFQSNLFEEVEGTFDLIVFNTPLIKINPTSTGFVRFMRKFFPNGVPLVPHLAFLSQANKRKELLGEFLKQSKKYSNENTNLLLLLHKSELPLLFDFQATILQEFGSFRIVRAMTAV